MRVLRLNCVTDPGSLQRAGLLVSFLLRYDYKKHLTGMSGYFWPATIGAFSVCYLRACFLFCLP
jgi:hypothetical protein